MQILATCKRKLFFAPLYFCLTVMAIILIYPEIAAENVSEGIRVCVEKVIPSVFPFAVLCRIFISLGGTELLAKPLSAPFGKLFKINGHGASVFILGLLSGYPTGAVCTAELCDKGVLSKDEAQRLCAFTNNASPAFLIGAVGMGFFSSKKVGYLLFMAQLISSVITGIILSYKKEAAKKELTVYKSAGGSISYGIISAVSDSAVLMLKICGTVIFFELICGLAMELFFRIGLSSFTSSLFFGGMEISFASEYLSSSDLRDPLKYVLAAAFAGWSGASVHMQVKEAVGNRFSLAPYLKGKILCAFFSAFLMYIFLSLK